MVGTMFANGALAALGDQDQVKVGVHLIPKPLKGTICSVAPAGGYACDSEAETSALVVQGAPFTSYYQYIVLLDINTGPGVAGVALGINYGPNLGFFGTETCADIEFPDANWPGTPPAGNTITWDSGANCQQTVDVSDPQGQGYAVAWGAYTYAYGDELFEVIQRPVAVPDFKVSDCTAAESNPAFPEAAGKVGYGNAVGYQPCVVVVPVEESTWGGIKSQFSGE
jgi:hypothetical protein